MSIDPEDSALEEALRQDLPSDEASARVRRRLLAAGLAVGNGMAVTTAAASGAAPGVVAGALAKVSALSWGIKVGLAAAIAIPTVGLIAERSQSEARVPPAVTARAAEPAARRVADAPAPAEGPAPALEPSPEPPTPAPVVARSAPVAPPEAKVQAGELARAPAAPSRVAFDAAEPPVVSKANSTLAEETRLLDAAFAALASGNKARAGELIAEHEARFPKGLLVRERERARVRLNEGLRGE